MYERAAVQGDPHYDKRGEDCAADGKPAVHCSRVSIAGLGDHQSERSGPCQKGHGEGEYGDILLHPTGGVLGG